VVDADPDLAAATAREFGAPGHSDALAPALADPAVNAVLLATPTALHAPQTIAAVRAGKHVLVEKPMAASADEARAMDAAARAAGVTLMVAHCCRFLPAFVEARRLLAAGTIGRPLQIQARRNVFFPPERLKPWWNSERPDGFLLSWLGSHVVDLTIWLLDRAPARVCAEFGRDRPALAVDDAFALLLWFAPGTVVSIAQTMNSRDPEHDYLIIGSEGTVRIRDYVHLSLDGVPIDLSAAHPPGLPLTSHVCYPLQQRAFFTAVRIGRPPAITGRDGIVTMAVLDACYRAGVSHTVEVPGGIEMEARAASDATGSDAVVAGARG
jgi:predicted dehydrogenase